MADDSIVNAANLPPATEAAEACDRSDWPVWVGRVGDSQPAADLAHLTHSQRVALCWEISKQAWLLSGGEFDESTFRRDVEVLTRRAAGRLKDLADLEELGPGHGL